MKFPCKYLISEFQQFASTLRNPQLQAKSKSSPTTKVLPGLPNPGVYLQGHTSNVTRLVIQLRKAHNLGFLQSHALPVMAHTGTWTALCWCLPMSQLLGSHG